MLAAYSDDNQMNYDIYLLLVLLAYRTSSQTTTGDSPFSLLYGREARLGDFDNYNSGYIPSEFVEDLKKRWREAKAKINKQAEYNEKRYNNKYGKPAPVYVHDELVRIKIQQTKPGLKTKLIPRERKRSGLLIYSRCYIRMFWNKREQIRLRFGGAGLKMFWSLSLTN